MPQHYSLYTKVVKRTLEPVWKEDWEVVVEEAMDQTLDLEMWDKVDWSLAIVFLNILYSLFWHCDCGTRTTSEQMSSWAGRVFLFPGWRQTQRATSGWEFWGDPPHFWKPRWLWRRRHRERWGSSPSGCRSSLEEMEQKQCCRFWIGWDAKLKLPGLCGQLSPFTLCPGTPAWSQGQAIRCRGPSQGDFACEIWQVLDMSFYEKKISTCLRNPVFEQGFLLLIPDNASEAELKVEC